MNKNRREKMKKLRKSIMKERMNRSRHLKKNNSLKKVFRKE